MKSATRVYVIGAGGHGKVVVRLLEELGYSVAAIFDDDPRQWHKPLLGLPVLGPVARIEEHPRLPAVVAVGDNAARRWIARRYPLDWLTAVHPSAIVDPSVRFGSGTVVLPRAVIQVDACLGDHVIVNTAATVDHDCRIGDYAHLAPGSHLAGGVSIGEAPWWESAPWRSRGSRSVPAPRWARGPPWSSICRLARWPSACRPGSRLRQDAESTIPPNPRQHESRLWAVMPGKKAMPTKRVYLSPPHMGPSARKLLLDAFDSNWIAPLGPHVDALEREFAAMLVRRATTRRCSAGIGHNWMPRPSRRERRHCTSRCCSWASARATR